MLIAKNVASLLNVSFPASVSVGKFVYYTVFNNDGSIFIPRTNTGVQEFGGGCFGVVLTFTSENNWSIVWDINGTQYKAGEEIMVHDFLRPIINNINQNVEFIKDVEEGRWKLENNQMIFYKGDNVTEIMRFNLFDDNGNPATEVVYERRKV
jgi:hypothetical protein